MTLALLKRERSSLMPQNFAQISSGYGLTRAPLPLQRQGKTPWLALANQVNSDLVGQTASPS